MFSLSLYIIDNDEVQEVNNINIKANHALTKKGNPSLHPHFLSFIINQITSLATKGTGYQIKDCLFMISHFGRRGWIEIVGNESYFNKTLDRTHGLRNKPVVYSVTSFMTPFWICEPMRTVFVMVLLVWLVGATWQNFCPDEMSKSQATQGRFFWLIERLK